MKKKAKNSSLLGGALQFLKGKPARPAAATASKSSVLTSAKTTARAVPAATSTYRSAEIVCGSDACEHARALSAIRFLAADIPRLPLAGCAAARCRCRYLHHTDRRDTADERRAQFSIRTKHYPTAIGEERRQKSGRRAGEAQRGRKRDV